jgi:hypothetical protein
MRTRLTRPLGRLTGAVALGAALGLAATEPAAAGRQGAKPDATPPCGPTCASYYVQKYGQQFVLNDFRGHRRTGTPIILFPASNSDKHEDWIIWPAGSVRRLAAFGLVSRALAFHYGADQAFEIQYAPYGVGSGQCAGTGRAAASGEQVSLQWCGRSARTIWVADTADEAGGYVPLIAGSDTDFSDPQVLTEPRYPMNASRPALITGRLQTFTQGPVYDDQMWDNTLGVLP